ncbi:UNVERIFIED_ORG: chemotaxis protein CheX [Peribacillus simplex]
MTLCAELGNMLAVNIATSLTVDETIMDITPPTVFVGQINGFNQVIIFPIILNGTHKIHYLDD